MMRVRNLFILCAAVLSAIAGLLACSSGTTVVVQTIDVSSLRDAQSQALSASSTTATDRRDAAVIDGGEN
jgi:hypothetical protein